MANSVRLCASTALVAGLLTGFASAATAGECTGPNSPIETDRPDVTNSAVVVPVASLQNENGVDLQRKDGAQALSSTNSRWRLGVAPCLEVLVDLPNYFTTLRGSGASGFSDMAPALKWQLNLPKSKFETSRLPPERRCLPVRTACQDLVFSPMCKFPGLLN